MSFWTHCSFEDAGIGTPHFICVSYHDRTQSKGKDLSLREVTLVLVKLLGLLGTPCPCNTVLIGIGYMYSPNMRLLGTFVLHVSSRPNQGGIIWVTHHCLKDSTCSVFLKVFCFVSGLALCQVSYCFTCILSLNPHNSLE